MVSALIPAAGRGERLGRGINKAFVSVAGKPILVHTLAVFETCEAVDEIVVVTSLEDMKAAEELIGRFHFNKVRSVITGGSQRQESVENGLKTVSGDIVVIHDAARPMVTHDIIERSIKKAEEMGACIAAVPVIDTIKMASRDGIVAGTIDRSSLYAVQTPQTFQTDLIRLAHAQARANGQCATDDAALVEAMGREVAIVQGSYENIKITTPADLEFASSHFGSGEMRTGIGLDVHAFAEGRKLILGGVDIACEKGLAGHSDADVLLHAIADACLGAAAMGDIGRYFPDTDLQYKGISSLKLLDRVGKLIADEGWRILNIDAVLAFQRPKIASYVPQMRENISRCLAISVDRVSVKGTTTEHLGFEGRGEGISCYAVATLALS